MVINGKGYMLLQSLEPSLPFRTHRAVYSYTPTFIERTNVSGAYGDNTQDFFLTAAQADWSLGDNQLFFRSQDTQSTSRFWSSSNLEVSIPGQVTIRPLWAVKTQPSFIPQIQPTVSSLAAVGNTAYGIGKLNNNISASYSTLVSVGTDGTMTSVGNIITAGATYKTGAICTDGVDLYISGPSKTIRWQLSDQTSHSFSSTAGASALTYSLNTLWGFFPSTGQFGFFDTAGTYNTAYTWKQANGTALTNMSGLLQPFGGKIAVLTWTANTPACLYLGDNSGVTQIAELPKNFSPYDMEVLDGVIFCSGTLFDDFAYPDARAATYYYANGNVGELWRSQTSLAGTTTIGVPLTHIGAGLMIADMATNQAIKYNPAAGGTSGIFALTNVLANADAGETYTFATVSAVAFVFPTASYCSSATLATSLFDFDNSLTKYFSSVKIGAQIPAGASIDLAYQLDGLSASYTSLATGVADGVEYKFPANTTGHAVSIQVTLNLGSASTSPVLKRIYVRGAPALQSYRNRAYIIDLSGIGYEDNVYQADGMPHPLSGHEQADNLNVAIAAGTVTVSDRFINNQTCINGTTTAASFTAVLEPGECEIYDTRAGNDSPENPGGFVAKITVREI